MNTKNNQQVNNSKAHNNCVPADRQAELKIKQNIELYNWLMQQAIVNIEDKIIQWANKWGYKGASPDCIKELRDILKKITLEKIKNGKTNSRV